MTLPTYSGPMGGLPSQTTKLTDRARFTPFYGVIPQSVMRDIVTSNLPHWHQTRAWILARPMTGFAETFSWYVMEMGIDGGSENPETEPGVENVLFVTEGCATLTLESGPIQVSTGSYAYIPANMAWKICNEESQTCTFHWIRKTYQKVDGIPAPQAFVTSDQTTPPTPMPDCEGVWATTRFVDPDDLSHDMHVNIVTFEPGGTIPFAETHVMEHGLYVLEGKAVYHLNEDWVEVEAGDFLWLRAFCPQACYASGPGKFRYLLYKDVNRHAKLNL